MNIVLDDADEVWIKETKAKKVGDRNTLGLLFLHLLYRSKADVFVALNRTVIVKRREYIINTVCGGGRESRMRIDLIWGL